MKIYQYSKYFHNQIIYINKNINLKNINKIYNILKKINFKNISNSNKNY